jgi:chorismate dehydratase
VIEAGKNKLGLELSVIKEYFDLLYCDFDDKKVQAMGLFFDSLLDQGILNERADIEFFI